MATQTLPVQDSLEEALNQDTNGQAGMEMADVGKLLDAGICPDCRSRLAHESGCMTCHSCGFSVC